MDELIATDYSLRRHFPFCRDVDRVVQCTVYDCNITVRYVTFHRYLSFRALFCYAVLKYHRPVPSYNVDCSLFIAIIFIVLDFDNLKCHNF